MVSSQTIKHQNPRGKTPMSSIDLANYLRHDKSSSCNEQDSVEMKGPLKIIKLPKRDPPSLQSNSLVFYDKNEQFE